MQPGCSGSVPDVTEDANVLLTADKHGGTSGQLPARDSMLLPSGCQEPHTAVVHNDQRQIKTLLIILQNKSQPDSYVNRKH